MQVSDLHLCMKIEETRSLFLFPFRSISSPMYSVLVNDGSVCGESSFCQNNTCVQQQQEPCDGQKTCSGNGVSEWI